MQFTWYLSCIFPSRCLQPGLWLVSVVYLLKDLLSPRQQKVTTVVCLPCTSNLFLLSTCTLEEAKWRRYVAGSRTESAHVGKANIGTPFNLFLGISEEKRTLVPLPPTPTSRDRTADGETRSYGPSRQAVDEVHLGKRVGRWCATHLSICLVPELKGLPQKSTP